MTTPDCPPWSLSPLMLKSRAVCAYAKAVLGTLPDTTGRRDPGAIAWAEVMRAHVESFDNPQ